MVCVWYQYFIYVYMNLIIIAIKTFSSHYFIFLIFLNNWRAQWILIVIFSFIRSLIIQMVNTLMFMYSEYYLSHICLKLPKCLSCCHPKRRMKPWFQETFSPEIWKRLPRGMAPRPRWPSTNIPGRPGLATFLLLNYHWSTLLHMEVVRSVTPLLHFFVLILHSAVISPLATYIAFLADL